MTRKNFPSINFRVRQAEQIHVDHIIYVNSINDEITSILIQKCYLFGHLMYTEFLLDIIILFGISGIFCEPSVR